LIARKGNTAFYKQALKTLGFLALLLLATLNANAQNTKGDKPITNQRQVREAKFKTIKKKKRIKTRDISGRRLRTLNQSSASRANRRWEQTDPYRGRMQTKTDKAAQPRGRIFNTPPSDRSRAWKGNISGHKIRVQSEKGRSARTNIYPQRGPFVNNSSQTPRKPKVYTRTASGKKPIKQIPKDTQRAWKGNIKGGPVGIPSRSGELRKIYPQSGRYITHSSKSGKESQRTYRNQSNINKAAKLDRTGKPGKKINVFPNSRSGPFISRGKRNVYWGKFSKGEKPFKGDITGRPLRMRNFRSAPAGLVARDTLKFFGRKPGGDRAYSGKKGVGFGISKSRNSRSPLPPCGAGIGAEGINYSGRFRRGQLTPGFSTQGTGFSGNIKSKKRISGGAEAARFQGNMRRGAGAGFTKQGVGFAGNIKSRRPDKGGGSVSGKRWNNDGTPIPVRTPRGGTGINYSGTFRKGELSPGFSKQGTGFSGNIKSKRPQKGGGSVSGKRWNNDGTPIPVRTPRGGTGVGDYSGTFRRGELAPGFNKQGADFAGNIKTRRPAKGGGSVSGKLWNNQQTPIPVRTPKGGTGVGDYSGTFRRGELAPGFNKQGADFAGNIKTRRPAKGGGSVSGKLWNNQQTPIPVRTPKGGTGVGDYSGTFRRGELAPGFNKQGADFAGNIKTRRPAKGGGSVSGKLWNNNQTPIPVRTPKGGTGVGDYSGTFRRGELAPGFNKQGADFAGNIKTKRPAKGGGSVSGKLWNNNETPIDGRTPSENARQAAGYPGNYKLFDLKPSRRYQGEEFTGNIKASKPKKGGGSVSGQLWNNNETPIEGRVPKGDAKAVDYAGRIKLSGLKKNYVQNPNASKESILKQRPDKTTYEVAGLQIKVKQGDYQNKSHAAKGSLPGVAPSKASVRASEYAKGVKVTWDYKRNPLSASEALKGRAPNKAYAKIGDYQGNIKMKKYGDNQLHPDAQFAHGFRNNVKEERTIFMNIKLMWAKLFNKSDTQPDHLKDKERRPRYDKREKGLWYE